MQKTTGARALSVLLAAALAATLCPLPAFATDAAPSGLEPLAANQAAGDASATPAASAASAGGFATAEEAIRAAQSLETDGATTVLVGFDPLFPEDGYTVSISPDAAASSLDGADSPDEPASAYSLGIAAESTTLGALLDAGWESAAPTIDVTSLGTLPATNEQFDALFRSYIDHMLDRPGLFNVRTYLNAALSADRTQIVALLPSYITTDADTLAQMQADFDLNVQRALACVDDSMTDESKVYALHDWLCNHATYNRGAVAPDADPNDPEAEDSDAAKASYPSFTAYGCMVDSLGVCQSYMFALAYLLDQAGVENAPLLVTSENHAWNAVNLDGSWYHVDATWNDNDDPGAAGNPDYSYFLKSGTWFASPAAGYHPHSGWTDSATTYGWDSSFTDGNRNLDGYQWKRYAPQGNRLCDFVKSSTAGDLALVVKYDALKAGDDTDFFAQGWGGKGDYLYSFQPPMLTDGLSDYPNLVDPTNATFNNAYTMQDAGSFPFEFTVSGTYRLRITLQDNLYGDRPVKTASSNLVLTLNSAEAPSVANRCAAIAAQCNANLGANATDFDRALWLHDYLIDNAEYDLRFVNAEGVLARGLGNCESYHAAYCNLLKAVGIETGRIASVADNHVWTAVRLDGKWYQVDVTWDDENIKGMPVDLRHIHFGLTDELMALAHPGHTQPVAGYESTSLDDNYFIRTGAIDPFADEFEAEINDYLAKGASSFSIEEKIQNHAGWMSAYDGATKSILGNLIAYELGQRSWTATLGGTQKNVALKVTYTNKSNVATGKSGGTFAFTATYADATHTHRWGAWSTTKDATCTAAGQQKRTCSTCGASETRTLAALGHGFGAWVRVKEPTTQAQGQDARTCSRCGAKETRAVAKLPAPTTPATPAVKPGWSLDSGVWQYRHSDGSLAKGGWERISGTWYLFDRNGGMLTGWQKVNGTWYYLKASGAMAEGWQQVGGTWYYLKPGSGAMAEGWASVGGAWYYLRPGGAMAEGWQQVGGTWYYLKAGGAMAEGWASVGGAWYYLRPGSGAMAEGWQQVGGTWYYLRPGSGAMVTGWLDLGGTWYWMESSGAMATGSRWVDGAWNRFSGSGAWLGA